MARQPKQPKRVKTLSHKNVTRPNNPTAEMEGLVRKEEADPKRVDHARRNNPDDKPELYGRNEDLDPQLVWLGKDEEDREPLSVDSLPIYVQEHIHPKAIVEDIHRLAQQGRVEAGEEMPDLFADWAGELTPEDRVEFYQHQQKWTNRMILGDSLQVMTSLAEKEGLKGQVQCIYMDPPYGIKFSSNWQTSTKSRNVKDNEFSREPEMIKAFRDTWQHGINSYLSYLRDRLTVARDLLNRSGSIVMQIGDENVHLVRSLMDEVFGKENFISIIPFRTKTRSLGGSTIEGMLDFLLVYSKEKESQKFRKIFEEKKFDEDVNWKGLQDEIGQRSKITKEQWSDNSLIPKDTKLFRTVDLRPAGFNASSCAPFTFQGKIYPPPGNSSWLTTEKGLERLSKSDRLIPRGQSLERIYFASDYAVTPLTNLWSLTRAATDKIYVVQSSTTIVSRIILMTTDPGDLVIDPTCGSGTTAYVAEQWGRRWITTDTSRVSLTLARTRLMSAHFDYYLLNDSQEGAKKELEVSGQDITRDTYSHNIQNGFVLGRVPHVTTGSIANNAEIDTIWEKWQEVLESLRETLNTATSNAFEEWEVPREAETKWNEKALKAHTEWWEARINRQQEIDTSITRNAATEYLHDKPYKQSGVVRVTGPFTVESLSPHRVVPSDAEDVAMRKTLQEIGEVATEDANYRLRPASIEEGETKFHDVVFQNLRKSGVQNTKKDERLEFTSLEPWHKGTRIQFEGSRIQFEGRYTENNKEKKAAICIGPEYGTVTRSLLVQAARESADYFDLLIVMGFAFEAYADDELVNIGRMRVWRANMNTDLHMADKLKAGKSGNLFVVFGEPDIETRERDDGNLEVEILGVDIFDPTTGEVKSSGPEDIACWFIDTDYNEEAFFVRHAYFSGAGKDPYNQLKRTLKAEIDVEAWSSLYATTSRPFPKPESRRIAVKAINHYGDEVLRVFRV